jgi:AraC-like DNA-binding protein
MKIEKSEIYLDPSCPFSIDRQLLNRSSNRKGYFHWHSCFEITCILSGQGRYFVNEEVYEVTDGDIILFNNVEPHGWEIVSRQADLLVMVFSPEYIMNGFSVMDYDYLKPFINRGSNFKNKLDHNEPLTGELTALIHSIAAENEEKNTGYQLMIKATVLKILTLLIRNSQDTSKSSALLQEKKAKMMRLSSVFDYINENYSDQISLTKASEIAYMSPNYFSAYFKKVTGKTFIDYVSELRINRADKLMETTDLSVLDIATRCGFHNMSNFYRIYKKIRKTSPGKRQQEADRPTYADNQ